MGTLRKDTKEALEKTTFHGEEVAVVERSRPDLDRHLSRTRLRLLALDERECIEPETVLDLPRAHRPPTTLGWVRSIMAGCGVHSWCRS